MPLSKEEIANILKSDALTAQSLIAILGVLGGIKGKELWNSSEEPLQKVAGESIKNFFGYFNAGTEKPWAALLKEFVDKKFIDQATYESLVKMKDLGFPTNWIALIVISMRLSIQLITAKSLPAEERMAQQALSESRPTLPDFREAINAAFIAPEKTKEVRDYLARFGLSEEAIDLLFISHYRLYDENTVRELFLRKIITAEKAAERLREIGYTDTRIKEMTEAWEIIPPVQDILTMVGKEAFEPDAIEAMGLGAEFPEEVSPWLEKQGLSRYWQEKYWFAHWMPPSIQLGYEMLHRGIIGDEELDVLFRTVEVPPYWRSKLRDVAYHPYTRVDARRMHKLKVLNDDELIRAYMDMGYDEEKAGKMAEFTKAYNKGAEKDLTKGEVLKGYREHLVSESQTREFLIRLGYDEDEATYIIAMEDYKEAQETESLLISTIEQRYKNGLIQKAEARRLLDELNMSSIQRDALLAKWEAVIIQSPKFPSKTDLEDFYRAGIIGPDVFKSEMQKLGYSSHYIEWYAKLAFAQGPRFGAETLSAP